MMPVLVIVLIIAKAFVVCISISLCNDCLRLQQSSSIRLVKYSHRKLVVKIASKIIMPMLDLI